MRIPLVASVIAQLLRPFGLAFILPALLALIDGDMWLGAVFVGTGLLCGLLGTLAERKTRRPRIFYRAEALAVVSGAWLAVSAVSAIPYLFCGLSLIDALFESMSGLTTTGATIFTHFDYPRALFLWRALTQWFGGLGVIALFVVVLPRLGIAGRQLFFAEASAAPGDAISPQVRQAASMLWVLYTLMTALCTGLLYLTGMDLFDAICNSMATLAAGGFSPNSESILGYHNPGSEWVLVVFMLLAGASYPLQLRAYTGDLLAFFRDGEFMLYLGAVLLAAGLLFPMLSGDGLGSIEVTRIALFQVTSLISSTGFASLDYNVWPDSARAVLVLVMVVGGCAGSAAGGPKVVRHLLMYKHIFREIKQALHPRAVLPLMYNSRSVSDPALRSVFALVMLYFGGYLLLGLVLTVIETDFVTAFSAAIACLGNIGPGFEIVGPEGSYHTFSDTAKALLFVAMWVGRLEILTVLALLHPDVWRSLRRR